MNQSHYETNIAIHWVFLLSILLNTTFVLVETYYGLEANSLSLIANAVHNLSDVAALVIAWLGYQATHWAATTSKTFGWQRLSIMAALINSSVLLIGMIWMAVMAVDRLLNPETIAAETVIWVASLGIIINGISAYLLERNSHNDLNMQGAFLHMLTDTFVSIGVVVSALTMHYFGWWWIDGTTSLIIALIIALGSFSLFKQSWHLCLDGVPEHISLPEVQKHIKDLEEVVDISRAHLWALGTRTNAFSAQILCKTDCDRDQLLDNIKQILTNQFGLTHTTIELKAAKPT